MEVIVHRTGEVFYSTVPTVHTHEDIIRFHNLPDALSCIQSHPDAISSVHPDYARAVFHGSIFDVPESYSLSVEQTDVEHTTWPWVIRCRADLS